MKFTEFLSVVFVIVVIFLTVPLVIRHIMYPWYAFCCLAH